MNKPVACACLLLALSLVPSHGNAETEKNSITGALREAFLANLPLFLVVGRLRRDPLPVIPRDLRWTAAAAIAIVAFALTMGRGLRF